MLLPRRETLSRSDQLLLDLVQSCTDTTASAATTIASLELGLGVLEQHLEVGLVPGTSLGRGLEGVVLAAEAVVPGGGRVAGSVGLATGLDPDEGIGKLVAGVGRGADTESGAVDVAPVTPLVAQASDGVAAGIDDGVVGHAGRLEQRRKGVDVDLLVLARVVLGIRGIRELTGALVPITCALAAVVFFLSVSLSIEETTRAKCLPSVPTGSVGGNTTNLLGATGGLVDVGKLLRTGLEVGIPAQPTTVTSVDVHDDVGEVKVLKSVRNTITVTVGAVLAGLQVGVGHQVGERIGLDEEREGRLRVGLDDLDDGYGVAHVR